MPREARNEPGDPDPEDFATVMHDIRGSLHAIRMGRELLKQMVHDEKFSAVCDAMEIEERKTAELLDQLAANVRRRA